MKISILCFLLFFTCCLAIGQSWNEPGKVHEFVCRSAHNPDTTIILKVVYDEDGTATVSKAERLAQPEDGIRAFSIGPPDDVEVNREESANGMVKFSFKTDEKYWFIIFDSYVAGNMEESKMPATDGSGVLILYSKNLILN